MPLPTEPIGSIPRPVELREAMAGAGPAGGPDVADRVEDAVRDTIQRFMDTGSPVITDGEQGKPSFATYPLEGVENLAPDGREISFEGSHTRRFPRLTRGPFRYGTFAEEYLDRAMRLADRPVKQAVIAPSALSLLYPEGGIAGYDREAFHADLVDQAEEDVRRCLVRGAHVVQMDFTEGRLALKLDPSGDLLREFVELNNRVLDRFSYEEQARLGVHSCPGGDRNATHSADVDYRELLPQLFRLNAGNFYLQLASEEDRDRVLRAVAEHSRDDQRVFVGVIDPTDPRVESPETVRDRALEAADHIAPARLGTTDDCGFSPFGDDGSTARDTAFGKIRARVVGTRMAEEELGI